jgi:uncharacterized protein (UPF0332 family)
LERAFQGTPTGELPQLRFFKHVCTIQQFGKWFIKATDCHRLGSGARQETVNARNLPTSIKVALMTKDKATKNPDELLRWMKDVIPSTGEY